LLRSLIDAGMVVLHGSDPATADPAISDIQVPDTLQGVIAARIDRLPTDDKRTLQTASVIGRVFQQRVLAHLRDREAAREPVERSLGELRRREFIHLRMVEATKNLPDGIDQEYIFKHVLTQDVTYNTLLLARRRELHRLTGEAMEALFGDYLDELSPTLGYHFERAQVSDKAVRYLARAGDRARATYANAEALAFYQAALAQADRLRDQDNGQAEVWRAAAVQLHENRGNVLELTARHEDARAAYQNALALVSPPDRIVRSRLYRAIAKTWQLQHSYDDALRAFAAAETSLGEASPASAPPWWQEWIQIHLDRL
jgi:predicted ATPase